MLKHKEIYLLALTLCVGLAAHAQVSLSDSKGAFPIVSGSRVTTVCYDSNDAAVVAKVADLFADDVKAVGGCRPKVVTTLPTSAKSLIIVGTIGQSGPIDALVRAGKIDVSNFAEGWERYGLFCVEDRKSVV